MTDGAGAGPELKIRWGSPPVWVRFPPPAPSLASLGPGAGAGIRHSAVGASRLGFRERFPPPAPSLASLGPGARPFTAHKLQRFDPASADVRGVAARDRLSGRSAGSSLYCSKVSPPVAEVHGDDDWNHDQNRRRAHL